MNDETFQFNEFENVEIIAPSEGTLVTSSRGLKLKMSNQSLLQGGDVGYSLQIEKINQTVAQSTYFESQLKTFKHNFVNE